LDGSKASFGGANAICLLARGKGVADGAEIGLGVGALITGLG